MDVWYTYQSAEYVRVRCTEFITDLVHRSREVIRMMTLEQAIEHAKDIANDYESYSKGSDFLSEGCLKCAEEHKQLAEWLTELKYRREYEELDVVYRDEFVPVEDMEIYLPE